ncbi:hypothetical protein DNO_0406 [Dichelobacter nodosus VCS1703A]|uniref:Uncharacterized protein n=1 Tax=Dichelobacter nodosus (strain VCS1703A) TaxID=246195 RepID=A5EVX9_DICNV|nr:hypothetical protein DNO_0406 [Dichelobacter nodosus VCS1703A]
MKTLPLGSVFLCLFLFSAGFIFLNRWFFIHGRRRFFTRLFLSGFVLRCFLSYRFFGCRFFHRFIFCRLFSDRFFTILRNFAFC